MSGLRRNFARTLAAAFLLAVAAALLLLPSAPADAQTTTTTYVSNIGQGSDSTYGEALERAQNFTTGTQSGGYTVTHVDIVSEDAEGDCFSVVIWKANNSNNPDTGNSASKVADLTAPSSCAAGTLTFTAPDNTNLAASTQYSLVINTGGNDVDIDATTSGNEDPGASSGWSIRDSMKRKFNNIWGEPGPKRALQIAIKATTAATNSAATGAPAITGTAQVGQTLTAVISGIMDSDGLATSGYTYQWIRVDGGTDANISGATLSTYTLVAADLGKTIKVKVSFTDDASNAETLTSAATAVVSKFVDFSDLQTGHTSPIGMWSPDGSTLWVGQWFSTQVYAYNLADETANYSENWTLHNPATVSESNRKPTGIWSNGTHIYVTDPDHDRVFPTPATNR